VPAKPKFTISAALICDDYRQEMNGKGLLIGVYGNRIIFTEEPQRFKFWACLLGTVNESFGIEIKAEFVPLNGEDNSKFQVGADIVAARGGESSSLFLPVKDIKLAIRCPGRIEIKVKEKAAKKWKLISVTDLSVNPEIASEFQQLS